ncbi:hypothetical protein [Streptomyces sp. NPDC001652]|uniref:hypothetical protein n=1 Tax=Streptomyces sp. NPDC001652 TaxID=3154393 RepID=UPI0033262951
MSTPANDEQRRDEDARLVQLAIHEENMLNQRGNLCLVAQSLLVVAYSTTATTNSTHAAARVMAGFGIALAVIWAYSGSRHHWHNRVIQRRLIERFPDVAEILAEFRRPGPSSTLFIVYGMPALTTVMWIVMLIIT